MSLFGKTREGQEGQDGGPGGAGSEAPETTHKAAPASRPGRGRGGSEDMANIGKSISIKGDLTGNEDLVLEGKVEGKVDLPNNQLTIGANGAVKAEIQAKAVIVVGKVTGNIRGTDRIEIQATGVVDGDVSAPRLVVAEGAVLNGSIAMSEKGPAAASPPEKAQPRAVEAS